jgi:hypothetical protein
MRLLEKTASALALVLLTTSIALFANSAYGQVAPLPGVTNWHDGSSMPLPAGVTPDATFDTRAHISFSPDPIGVGQPLLINVWVQPPIHVTHYFKDAFQVTITKPDGTKDVKTLSSYQGDSTAWLNYVTDQVGNWTIKFDFLGAYFPAGNYTIKGGQFSATLGKDQNQVFPLSAYYKPSSDGPYNVVVQSQMAASWPAAPLPTDFWTRPISPEDREWWSISGNYPGTGVVGGGPNWPADTNTHMSNYGFTPYVQAPNTAHVVWRRQGAISGLIGGSMGTLDFSGGGGNPSIIYAGRCYQTLTKVVNGVLTSVWQCYDLRTGQVYWERTDVTQVPTMISYVPFTVQMVPGTEASPTGLSVSLMYVGSGRLIKYDPYVGSVTMNISIAPLTTGTMYAPDTFLSVQNIGTTASPYYRLISWAIGGYGAFSSNLYVSVLNNVSYPFSSVGSSIDYDSMIAITTVGIRSTAASGLPSAWETTGGVNSGVTYNQIIMATSLTTGQLLWNITTDVSTGGPYPASVADQGKFAVHDNDGYWHCYDLQTGKQLWVSELSSWPWGTFGAYAQQSAYGLLFWEQYDGVVAYNWTTGKVAWHFEAPAPPFETPYTDANRTQVYSFYSGATIADGKLYTWNTEHTASLPLTRGWSVYCINATTGQGLWNLTGAMTAGAIADGYLTASNSYDGYMYVFGKGTSATTVTAPQTTVALGTSVVIQGSVFDMSPGTMQPTDTSATTTMPLKNNIGLQNVPCVSDSSMSTQMDYLYMNGPIDGIWHNVTMVGVPVTLTAIGSDGSVINIGTTTTNANHGTFSFAWNPPREGLYTITASFVGTDSYGSSSAAAAVSVGPAPATINIPQAQTPPDYTIAIIGAAVAIIVAVVIVGLALFFALRKR